MTTRLGWGGGPAQSHPNTLRRPAAPCSSSCNKSCKTEFCATGDLGRGRRAAAVGCGACHTRRVIGARYMVTCMLVLGALVLAVPAATLAAGGGSAGDNQYTDPFASSTTTAAGAPPSTTTSAPAPSASPPATTTPPAASSSAPAASAAAGTPTATIASTATGSATPARTLPFTGYPDWLAAGAGFILVAGGLALRLRTRGT